MDLLIVAAEPNARADQPVFQDEAAFASQVRIPMIRIIATPTAMKDDCRCLVVHLWKHFQRHSLLFW